MNTTTLDISVVIPCLNEGPTIGDCVRKAREAISGLKLKGEVLVVDNGSTDASAGNAKQAGARVVPCPVKGYGAALRRGIEEAQGRWVIMGDGDDTYDFREIPKFVGLLSQGADLVMGSRLKGRIQKGAMPWLHRFVGTPILTGILNFFFHSRISDANCGMRGFTKEAARRMALQSRGMEFASEMVVKAAQRGMDIRETPVNYGATAEDRVPKLNTFRDGWRHLRFMLLLAPQYLFIYPGLIMGAAGAVLTLLLLSRQVILFQISLGLSSLLLANALVFMGIQVALFGVYALALRQSLGFFIEDSVSLWFLRRFDLESGLVAGGSVFLVGLGLGITAIIRLLQVSHPGSPVDIGLTHLSIAALFSALLGIQIVFSSFYLTLFNPPGMDWLCGRIGTQDCPAYRK